MSTVDIESVALPSPPMLTIAIDVVGAIEALKPTAIPRPRRMVPVPRSKGFDHSRRSASFSSTPEISASRILVPVACGRPSRRMFLRRNSSGSIPSPRAIMSVCDS